MNNNAYLQTDDFAGQRRNFDIFLNFVVIFVVFYELESLYSAPMRNWRRLRISACVFHTEECGKVTNSVSPKLWVRRCCFLSILIRNSAVGWEIHLCEEKRCANLLIRLSEDGIFIFGNNYGEFPRNCKNCYVKSRIEFFEQYSTKYLLKNSCFIWESWQCPIVRVNRMGQLH